MAFWDSLKAKTREMNSQLTTKAGQFKNKEFANGSMAMCALIAAADGSIDAAEQAKTMSLIRSNSVLISDMVLACSAEIGRAHV